MPSMSGLDRDVHVGVEIITAAGSARSTMEIARHARRDLWGAGGRTAHPNRSLSEDLP